MAIRQLCLNFLMMSFFPKNKGLSVGIASIGSSIASIFWSRFAVNYINYNGLEPDTVVIEGQKSVKYFSSEQGI